MTTPSQIDVSTLREGDVVTVRLRFKAQADFNGQNAWLENSGDGAHLVPMTDIVSVEPRPLKVGDRVNVSGLTAEILAINGKFAWVGSNEVQHWTYRLSDLVRA